MRRTQTRRPLICLLNTGAETVFWTRGCQSWKKWRGSPCRSAQTVDDLEETLDTLREEHSATLAALDDSRGKEQAQAIELAQLRKRLAATEKLSVNFFSVRR
ncbi:hypothetical protein BHM12_004772 [Escherichia coli]|nr:hypothetical protein [Escherichia coli]